MALIGACRGVDKETALLPWWGERHMRALFPHVPDRSRFNGRRRARLINPIRHLILSV